MKRFIGGFLAGALLFGSIGVFAVQYVANPVDFKILVNGEEFTSNPPALEINGRTYLPLRAIGNALDVPVTWNEELRQAEIGITTPAVKKSDDEKIETPHIINSGEVFDKNGYIEFDGMKITYTGMNDKSHTFTVYNNNDFDVLLSMEVVGVKKDGSTEWLGSPGLFGYDLDTYEKEKEENGWAIKKTTTIIKSKSTLEEYANLYRLASFGKGNSEYVGIDPDKDGYCDIRFTSYHQKGDGSIVTYTSAPESNLYRLIAK